MGSTLATLKELSEYTGFSVTTISRILNDDPTMNASEETRKAILEAAGKLNYRTTKSRRGRSPRRPVRIALAEMLSPTELLNDPYYLYLKNYVEQDCVEHGYDIAYLRRVNGEFQLITPAELDGIIAVGIFSPEEVASLYAIHPTVVYLDSAPEEERSDSVVGNLRLGVEQALNDFTAHGHTRIGFIGPLEKLDDHKQPAPDVRRQQFIAHMKGLGLFRPEYMIDVATDAALTHDALRALIATGRPLPTAFLTHNEQNAIGAMRALGEAGIAVPEQVSIIAFNDTPLAELTTPPLTSVSMHIREMSRLAVRLLVERVPARGQAEIRSVSIKAILPPALIRRGSVADVKA